VSEEQVGKRRRRRSWVEAERLVAEFEAGGLSREEFCRKHGLAFSTLARYRKRRERGQGEGAGPSRWLAVELAGSPQAGASGLALVLTSGRRIEVGREFDAKTLEQLVRLLEPV
jgi:transposase-like protein